MVCHEQQTYTDTHIHVTRPYATVFAGMIHQYDAFLRRDGSGD